MLSKPETVSALQELTRLAVQTKTGAFSRLILDIGGSRDARRNELAALVARAAERIEGGASEAALPPRCRRTSASSCTTSSQSVASTRSRAARALSATLSSRALRDATPAHRLDVSHVSRETMTDHLELEAEPAAAAELFGEHLDRGRAFTESLARYGEELGLIGPLELPPVSGPATC